MEQLSSERVIAFDTETTGLSPKNERIVEIAAMEFDIKTGVTGRYFHAYINPEIPIPYRSSLVHGLTDKFIADKPLFAEVAPHFIRFISGAILFAHNAPFDIRFVNSELERLGLEPITVYAKEVNCTRAMARKAHPGQKATLDALCDRYQVDRSGRTVHGALIDCQLLAGVYPQLAADVELNKDLVKEPKKRVSKSTSVVLPLVQATPVVKSRFSSVSAFFSKAKLA